MVLPNQFRTVNKGQKYRKQTWFFFMVEMLEDDGRILSEAIL
jgi:hypothetical protein